MLAGSGTYLFFEYRPSPSGFDLSPGLDTRVKVERIVREFHRVDAWLVAATLLALGIVVLVERVGRRWDRINAWGVLAICALASITGLLLPWDQLALWSVTVGANLAGYRPIVDEQIRFVLIDHEEIGPSTVLRWLVVHIVLGLVALAAIVRLVFGLRGSRRSPREGAAPATA